MPRPYLLLGVIATSAACALNHPSFGWTDAPPSETAVVDNGPVDVPVDLPVDAPADLPVDAPVDLPDSDVTVADDGPTLDVDDVLDVADAPDVSDASDAPDVIDAPDAPDVTDVPGDDGAADVPCDGASLTRCGASCVDAQNDAMNCGACGRVCAGGQVCSMGACQCGPGLADCDGNAANGCETDTTTSSTHCGACGRACAARANSSATCAGGMCVPRCNMGFGDCDGLEANGCEENLATSSSHCGTCGNACQTRPNSSVTCLGGTCALACTPGFGNCDANDANGCEIAGFTNPLHCGGCNMPCPTGEACNYGGAGARCIACAAPRMLCSGTCVDLQTDARNCGACGTVCPTGQACTAGRCACPMGQTACGSACANLQNDARNCGACGTVCPTGASCMGGMCRCPSGQTACGGRCVDTRNDDANCGACGNACAVSGACSNSRCICGGRGQVCCWFARCGSGLSCVIACI